ncbi:hypothetical protein MKX01_034050 [Papaver californicum]|nr:hypothetical protein MKX01_034050 [Papaver californicum]
MEGLGYLDILYKYGFGYDLKTEDYKFARMANCPGRSTDISVYSLRSDSWNIKNRYIPSRYTCSDHLVLFKRILHWVELPWPWSSEHPARIGSFDTGSKAFKEIPLPQHFSIEFQTVHVCLLRGCLYLIGDHWKCCEVWMMKEYGVHESWTKIFAIDKTKHTGYPPLELREYYMNGEILIQERNFYYFLYNINSGKAIKRKIVGILPVGFVTWSFLGSLVSPNLGTQFME